MSHWIRAYWGHGWIVVVALLVGLGLTALADTDSTQLAPESRLGPLYGYETSVTERSFAQYRRNSHGKSDNSFDEKGIIMVRYPAGWYYNPLTIANQGMLYYGALCKAECRGSSAGVSYYKSRMEEVYLFLRSMEIELDGMCLLPYAFSYEDIRETPWFSAFAQAVYLAFLDRCLEQGVGDPSEIELAVDSVLSSIETDVREGGVASTDADGFFWLEEYASEDSGLRHTLNGAIYAARILHRYAQAHPEDGRAEALFDRSLLTLKHYIPLYTTDEVVLYSANSPKVTPWSYFPGMTAIMESLGDELGDAWWYEWADRWRALAAAAADAAQGQPGGIRIRHLLALWGATVLLGVGTGASGAYPILRRHMHDSMVRRAVRFVALGLVIIAVGSGILACVYMFL